MAAASVADISAASITAASTISAVSTGGFYPYNDYYAYESYPYYEDEGGCYVVRRRVHTAYGWRVRRVQVCG